MTDPELPIPESAGPGQESAWDFPRPPRVEPVSHELKVWLNGRCVAWTTQGLRLIERAHPPVYLFPPTDVDFSVLSWSRHPPEACPHVGLAWFLDLTVPGPGGAISAPGAALSYTEPHPDYAALAEYVAYYAGAMDACTVAGELVTPQPGGWRAGWITRAVVGPFKGYAGSEHW